MHASCERSLLAFPTDYTPELHPHVHPSVDPTDMHRPYSVPTSTDLSCWEIAMDDSYHIHVRGHLEDRWSDRLGGLTIQRQDDGTTVLVGQVVDQAALHGV